MARTPFQVKALYEYSSPHDDDLSFPNGQVITVTDEEEADWYYGEYNDPNGAKHEGLFPRNFVKIYEPEMPPRPSRLSRSKKEVEPLAGINDADKIDRSVPTELQPEQPVLEQPSREEGSKNTQDPRVDPSSHLTQATRASDIPSSAPPMNLATKPTSSNNAKPAPLPVTEKPVIGSFRDRINAFNKPAAAPVAPPKPSGLGSSGGSSFIKKPFVAPPPSKNAYVVPPRDPPPQKMYRREEDPELAIQNSSTTVGNELAESSHIVDPIEVQEDVPKPTTLKDRIALLQKQQMEQAARHGEAGQKKEKPKRPPKRRVESQEHTLDQGGYAETENLGRADTFDASERRSMESSLDDPLAGGRPSTGPHKSKDATPLASPTAAPIRDFQSDANDADQSGAGETEDGDELSTGRDDSDEKPRTKAPNLPSRAPQATSLEEDIGNDGDEADEDEQEQEEIDPEIRRRMEIRERMAKMSGGMGMAGMFGPVGGVSPMASKKQGSASSDRKTSVTSVSTTGDSSASRAPPIQMMPMPGMQRVRTPEQEDIPDKARKDNIEISHSILASQTYGDTPNLEDLSQKPLPPSRRSTERIVPPPIPQDRTLPIASPREVPPLPLDRPMPSPRVDSRQLPSTPSQIMSPSEGSESDDEMSLRAASLSLKIPGNEDSRPTSQEGPPSIPSNGPPQFLPNSPQCHQSRASDHGPPSPYSGSQEFPPTFSMPTSTPGKRPSRVPPIPGSSPVIPSAPQTRAPPPPPPAVILSSRASTEDSKAPANAQKSRAHQYSDEEITEYEGDYDTDMAPGATRKEALRSHARNSSLENDLISDEVTFHHSGLPSLGPPTSAAPRAIPPPPPSQPPKSLRQSSEMPRAPPPPPPPAKEPALEQRSEDFDTYNPISFDNDKSPNPQSNGFGGSVAPFDDDPDNLYSASPPQRSIPTRPSFSGPQYSSPSILSAVGRPAPRQSLDVQRPSTSNRRSMDAPRQSSEQGFIASDVDMGQNTIWWAQPNMIPPVFQNRRDLIYEIEETSTTSRGGKQVMTRTLYVLYMDYSQTIISAQFETKNPTAVSLEQHHEPPPSRLRQDQLEEAHIRFGSTIGENASSKKDSIVGDGTPQALVLELFASLPDALLPVGVRAYGALVYANLANATVQQFDEIRSGDIVTFRNSRFQGHRGPMKSKYSIDIGKPDHVGVVVDWDGTKKKIRAWEQGRESKKVRIESFKLSDMRSGEVKVWRVMARSWVGWGGQK